MKVSTESYFQNSTSDLNSVNDNFSKDFQTRHGTKKRSEPDRFLVMAR